MTSESMQKIFDLKLVPLVVLDDATDAVPMAKALVEGGIPVAEVTFRTDAAADVIRAMAEQVPEILVGAGTVHTVAQAQTAVEAGAKFIVTPGFQPDVVRWCVEHQMDIVPGTAVPSDIEQAISFGLSVCKFFPAEAYGGVKTLKALKGPYADIRFMPTGGVSLDNMNDYLALSNVVAIGGSFMTPSAAVKAKDWAKVTEACRTALTKVQG
ncbi:bifunctional 4-hydroxy-2-oxoglutarate aldolase/2-dehydro-3-deoxy-phosphogluconate aldolase [Laedolimicola ammoniilytica]|uniref:2-dehydro-3-deoxy-phosphogluconate aldolase n=1 Tax=Laedolimicola ammoniilytica TaxID=2981771 RepID=A0ABT2S083_9FIRM|nr:bifunctional 4-hydroxy-2-oxoglutarate aldolase/2-dehydro-3-deoxy-phosphogluconate aldolase [Laedolimicola ammoniilytica]MCU6697827.1 bifunctional 4-hydroxy-2-oxoglutarate aldolase/2-dehydro-3-deoxy-phosphogluconate aldolase [Laedolimicola ammoniilytica]SCI48612.1 Putative KHG/KDPG aldolase [uncultured Clostridium sp.]